MNKKRRNIALLVSGFENIFVRQLCIGVMSAAVETDCNLVIFPGKFNNPPYYDTSILKYDYQFNHVFDYAKKTDFDAFLIELNTIGMYLNMEEKKEFLRSFGDVPIILLTCAIEGYFSVCFDNRAGLAEGIRHLIRDHHCRRIGFMAGVESNEDSIERYEVYKSVLEECTETFNPVVARFGGDEFCAFYLEEEGADSEKLIRGRAGEETERLNSQTDKPYYVSMSMGFCTFKCGDDVNLSDILERADAGLYVDKKNKEANVLK